MVGFRYHVRKLCFVPNNLDSSSHCSQNSCYISNRRFWRKRRSLRAIPDYRRLTGGIPLDIISRILPNFSPVIAAFVIVGMMAFFGGVGKVPVAVILMVSEMTGGFTLLVPSMIATTVAYIITGKVTIYRSQVQSRAESPAHRGEFSIPLLQKLFVKDAMTKKVITTTPNAPISEVAEMMSKSGIKGMPVLDSAGSLVGIVTLSDVLRLHPDQRVTTVVGPIMSKELVTTIPDDSLYTAFDKMTGNQIGRLPVVAPGDNKKLVGIIHEKTSGVSTT